MKLLHVSRLTTLLLCLAFSHKAISQGTPNPDNFAKMVDFLPPAPHATSIIKYGNISINKNNGAPAVSIPVTVVSSKRLKTSVSLGYNSTGIKVDEIASRVGMGWTIMAGGVITRTVRGTPDEVNQRLVPYATISNNMSTYTFMDKVAKSTNSGGGYDSEPDLFNFHFDGYSGSFVFDAQMNITPVEPNRFKYASNFSGTDWNFRITTPDGVSYFFGGSGATEKTKKDQVCGKLFDTYIPTSWYLVKIQHPNGDAILFSYTPLEYTYDNGVTQTMYYTLPVTPNSKDGSALGSCATQTCSNPANTTCVSLTRTQGVLLDKITVPNNQELRFAYRTRSDCGDRLIDKITLYDLTMQPAVAAKAWNFIYNEVQGASYNGSYSTGIRYTPYLVNFIERSIDSSQMLTHAFVYNDPASRPPRLSYAQDHWGYFNGRNNTSLIPPPSYYDALYYPGYFSQATADRNPVTDYAVKGMLAKVIYPTGGMDSLVYESNQVYEPQDAGPGYQFFSSVTGTGVNTAVYKSGTISLTSSTSQFFKLDFTCINNTGGSVDTLHNKGSVEILGPTGISLYKQLFIPGAHLVDSFIVTGTGNFTVKIQANGSIVTTKGSVSYAPSSYTVSANQLTAGLRVKTILTATDKTATPIVKRYFYGDINTPDQSSLPIAPDPVYGKNYETRMTCFNGPGGTIVTHAYCSHFALYSNSVNALFDFQYSLPGYASVIEVDGTDMTINGAVQTQFYTGVDGAAETVWGNQMLNAPKSNLLSLLNGKVKQETVFKSIAKILTPIKQTSYTYILDSVVNKYVYGYAVNQKFTNDIIVDTTCDPVASGVCRAALNECLDAFDMTRYTILSRWAHIDTVKEVMNDMNGANPVTTIVKNYFNDTSNLQLSQTDTYNSKGTLERAVYSYPKNYTGTSVYDAMLAANIISPVIDIKKYVNSIATEETKTNYSNWGNGNYLPASVQKAFFNNGLQSMGTFTKYDANGNILEYKGADGIPVAVVYGYRNIYPVAKIAGTTYNTAIAQLTTDTAQLQSLDGSALLSALNPTRNISGVQVTSYTYKHLAGVTSITSINNQATYYNYDSLKRLTSVQDFNLNYLKKIQYSYVQPGIGTAVKVYFNKDTTATFYCQCSTGYNAVPLQYTVSKNKYFSVASQAEADSLAAVDMAANGQIYANNFGKCTNGCSICTGLDKKCINDVCEKGTKMLLSSVQQANGTWLCTFYYQFSDGSKSANFTETHADSSCDFL